MKRFLQVAALGLFAGFSAAQATELDPKPAQRPSALIVREDANGQRVVFKSDLSTAVNSDEAAVQALAKLDASKQVATRSSELDDGSSTEAWYSYYGSTYGYGYNYGYNYNYYYGYRPYGYYNTYYYYPTYSYYYGSYRYSYYWCY